MKIYIAAPYTKGDIIANINTAITAAEFLAQKGWTPFIPHLTGFWHLQHQHEYEFWMSYDEEWLRACDALVRLDGESPGADREVQVAKSMGIPVYYGALSVPQL